MFANPRVRAVLGIGAALAVVAAVGIGVASSSSASASTRFVTTTSSTGDVTQTYTATGSITRKNTETASFAVSGTVNSVKVAVGDQVEAGQVLATIDSRALKLALLQAETTVAQAELNLYNAKHPSSSSSSSSSKKSTSSSSGSSSSSSSSSGSKTSTDTSLTTVTLNLTQLNEAVSAVNLAVVDEAKQCDAIMAWVNDETGSSSTTTTTTTSNDSSADKASSASTASTPSAAESSASAEPSASASPSSDVSAAEASESASASPSASATQYAATSDPTEDEIKACATARAALITANTTLQSLMESINTAAGAGDDNSSASPGTSGSGSSGSSSSSSSSSATVSASQVASAKATLLEAEQKLQKAKDNLADAELLAPISGVVGTVSIAKGEGASSGSVTIVGSGSAVVTFELPLSTRKLVSVGAAVTVTPADSSTTLSGKVTWISSLETSGTSGSTATYSTTVAVSDPDQVLLSGAKASVLIPVKSVTGVVRVPASAVTPTGTGTATVQTVTAANATSATSVTVKTGAVGGGWVEITSGLTAGQLVVLADSTEAIPTTTTSQRTTTSSTSTTSSSSAAVPSAAASSSQPSGQATK